jgi:hypothetical protein
VLGLLAHNLVHYFLRDPVDGITTGLLLGLAVRGAIDATTGSSRKCD